MRQVLAILALAAPAPACSEYAYESRGESATALSDSGFADEDTSDGDGASGGEMEFRLDVYPSSAVEDAGLVLEAQSWWRGDDVDDSELDSLTVRLLAPIEISGTITGYVTAPPRDPDVPGEGQGVPARIEIGVPGSITAATATADSDGRYDLRVTPDAGHRITVVPEDAENLPFVVTYLSLQTDNDSLDRDLGYGVPVWGQVTEADGSPVVGAVVHLLDAEEDVDGPTTTTSSTGHYMLRANQDNYRLVVEGAGGTYIPRVETAIEVQGDGQEVNLDIGALDPIRVGGRVTDSSGDVVRDTDVTVRFTSESLSNAQGTLQIETETDADGVYSKPLLPGVWTVEFIPPYESDLSPLRLDSVDLREDDTELPTAELADRVRVTATIYGPGGHTSGGVLVSAREVGFDRYVFSGLADDSGKVDMDVAATDLVFTLTPTSGDAAITRLRRDVAAAGAPDAMQLESGRSIGGTVTSSGTAVPYSLVEVYGPCEGEADDLDQENALCGDALTDTEGRFSMNVVIAR